ncbi:MAG: hypothetical protein ACOYVJ_05160 [Nitrospirota bacterium]
MADMIRFIYENTALVIALGVLSLLIFYRKPKVLLVLFLFIVIGAVTVYLIFNISETAVAYKRDLLDQTRNPLF